MMRVKRKRINMRIPEDLIEFIKKYAEKNSTTVTDDYIGYLTDKKSKEERAGKDEHPA